MKVTETNDLMLRLIPVLALVSVYYVKTTTVDTCSGLVTDGLG
jgi:hypothetical protein